ncbi:MAG: acyl-CoA dehydrogenase [Candidatus Marinimicrobia bacterium]|nr:acyl-CoA dehydrogenase [Candidatus Neomarinimicrobiota bacterium]|tara:strand:+ start:6597 stop:7748 length:1152 start_codon:yes stop_codon:yes gene_type:complete
MIYLTEEHLLLKNTIREFSTNEIKPLAQAIDENSTFPIESIKKLSDLGMMGIPWPEKYNGGGMDYLSLVIVIEEIAKVCVSTAVTLMAHTSLGSGLFALFGDENQKNDYLKRLSTGEILGAFALTEPNAGSDAGNTQTKAILSDGKFTVNGQKVFCTNAGYAGVIIFTARIIEDDIEKGVGALYVDAGTPGLILGEPEDKMGWKGSDTRSVYFDNMVIPEKNILGDIKTGYKQFLQTLTAGRITIAALSIGIAQGAYESALNYTKEREAFGKKINQFQAVSFKLADMATQIEAAKLLVYNAAWLKDQGKDVIKSAAMAKLFSSEATMKITTDAIQIHGGYGYIREYNVERFFRDAKILEIGEGTSEIQRIIISREILKSLRNQ